MTGPYELGDVPTSLRRRSNIIATVAMVSIAVALMVVVLLIEGVRPEPLTWAILGVVAIVIVSALVLAVRAITPDDRAVLERSQRRTIDPPPVDGSGGEPDLDLTEADLDLTDAATTDPLAPIPDDDAVLDAEASDIDLSRNPVVRVVLHPGPITRRRLAGRPDALVIVADAEALDVPGWIVEGRSRMIERTDRVIVPWSSVERFRVRADSDGPDVYDITAGPDVAPPRRWRIRRNEISDELSLLDHVRRVGRITIELEDSIRS